MMSHETSTGTETHPRSHYLETDPSSSMCRVTSRVACGGVSAPVGYAPRLCADRECPAVPGRNTAAPPRSPPLSGAHQ